MLIAVLEEYIFPIDFTQKKNFHQNSNSSYQYRSSNDLYTYFKTAIIHKQ
jgi:hypothetical protein